MPKLKLTDLSLRALKTDAASTTYWDTTLPAFGIRVGKNRKTFLVMLGKKRTRHPIGRYGELSLQEARRRAHTLIGEAQQQLQTAKPALPPLHEVLETFYATHCAALKPGSAYQLKRLLKRLPQLDMTSQQLDRLLDGIEKPSERLHAFRAFRVFYAWCSRRRFLTASPMLAMQPPGRDTIRERLLTTEEIVKIWHVAPPNVRLLIATGQRWNQIASLRRCWIEEDVIRFPAEIMKNGMEHVLPFGPLTVSLLATLPETGDLLFPARGQNKPMTHQGKSKLLLEQKAGVSNFVLHDIRRYYASTMASLGIPIATCELLLSHISGSLAGIVRVYQKYSFEKEKREAQLLYEKHLAALVN